MRARLVVPDSVQSMSYSTEHVLLCSFDREHAELKKLCLAVLLATKPKLKTCHGTSGAEQASLSYVSLQSIPVSGKERPLQHSEQMHIESAFKAFKQV